MFASGKAASVSAEANYIEDVFSTYLYTGNDATQTITNGIDLSGKGGMVWTKNRNATQGNAVFDTVRGNTKYLLTQTTDGNQTSTDDITGFLSTGYTLGNSSTTGNTNYGTYTYASWTFRKQPKFFDVVTYTGNGATTRNISHNLGSTPGCVIVKKSSGTGTWYVWHRSIDPFNGRLNTSDACGTSGYIENVTSTTFGVSYYVNPDETNVNGETYVAYLFAHNAGGFGLTGTDNVISCGSFTTDGSGNSTVNLGYEPQWVLMKPSTTATSGNWIIADNMRGWTIDGAGGNANQQLYANSSSAESGGTPANLTSTGFNFTSSYGPWASQTWIYIAIRRGPMKVPTDATKVFAPVTYTGNGSSQSLTAGFPISLGMFKYRGGATNSFEWFDRLRGASSDLRSAYTYAELATTTEVTSFASNTQVTVGASSDTGGTNVSGQTYVLEAFQRAPSFFDEVCYTGTGTTTTQTHNLQAVPELIIVKRRSGVAYWQVYSATYGRNYYAFLNDTQGFASDPGNAWGTTDPTSTTFSLSPLTETNASGSTYVAYLFATCAGVSKCTAFTGNGTSQTINCGFTSGARFVMIKATSTTGNWTIFDSARGISAGGDPALYLNSTAAEVTGVDAIDADSTGFIVNQESTFNLNASGVQYLVLAIA